MNQELNHNENIRILNAILVGYEYIECLDHIENTRYHQQNIKQKVQSLSALLLKTNALHEIAGINDIALIEMMKEKESLMKKIAIIRPELKSGLNMILTKFFENPVETLNIMGIEIQEDCTCIE